MNAQTPFTFELLKLANGARLLRVLEPQSATCLEKLVRSDVPIARQKALLSKALEAVLERELKETASAA